MISRRLYEVKEELDAYIREHGLKAGDRLPAQPEFAKILGISRLTLRECFKVFQKEGILRTVNGAGTYLCDASCHLSNTVNELIGTGTLIRLSGYQEGAQIIRMDREKPLEEWREALCLKTEDPVIVIKRVRTADQTPVAMAWNVFPEAYVNFEEIRERGFGTSIFAYLEEQKKIHISHAESVIQALRPEDGYDREAGELLGNQVILMKQVHFDDYQRPVFFSRDYFNTDCIALRLRRERKEW